MFPDAQKQHPGESYCGVYDKQFEAYLITAEPPLGVGLQHKAEQGGGHGYRGHIFVPNLTLGQDAEGEHSQYAALGITCHRIDHVYDALAPPVFKTKHPQEKGHGNGGVGHPASACQNLLVTVHRIAENIHHKGGRH